MSFKDIRDVCIDGSAVSVRIGFCLECGVPILGENERGHKRKFCTQKCKSANHNRTNKLKS